MAKYILVKKVKGKKYEYQVIDADSKAIVSKRTSAREYVACTADGSFYFGRLDLIGKGDHGKRLSHTAEILANPETCAKVVDVSKKYLETMRFALRKQDKIKAHFEPHGDEMLNRIKESLTRYFSADRSDFPEGLRDIESDYNQLPGEPYPTIAINDTGNPERMIEFYVTGKQYDVYHVAFKGFTKG